MNSPKEDKKNIFAIVQLGGMSRVIQALQACIELKKSHPEVKLIFICQEKFSRPLCFKLEEVFSHIIYINAKQLINSVKEISLDSVKKNLKNIIGKINYFNISVAINLTYTKTSSYLMALIRSEYYLGFVCDEDNKISMNDQWSQFFFSNIIKGPYGCLSTVDIFKGILGTNHNSFMNEHRELEKKKIIIHPFSLYKRRAWMEGKWIEVVYQVLKNNLEVKIGIMAMNEAEEKDANQMINNPILDKFSNRITIIYGSDIKQVYSEFRDTSLFIGHDSIGGHLASLFNVQSITINLGTMRPYEDTPYGQHNYSISSRINCFPCTSNYPCDTLPCHQDISHNVVYGVIDSLVKGRDINFDILKEIVPLHLLDKIDIYKTYVDEQYGMFLIDCFHAESTTLNLFRQFYRVLWSFILAEQEIMLPFPDISSKQQSLLEDYHSMLGYIIELNKFGRTYSNYIIEEIEKDTLSIHDIKKYSNKILEINYLLLNLKDIYPHLAPLIKYYHVSNVHAPGENLKEISESSLIIYHEAMNATKALQELLGSVLDNYQVCQENDHFQADK